LLNITFLKRYYGLQAFEKTEAPLLAVDLTQKRPITRLPCLPFRRSQLRRKIMADRGLNRKFAGINRH
jgi:hypothetical protein